MTDKQSQFEAPAMDDAGWITVNDAGERTPAIDWDDETHVVGRVLEVGEVNVSKTSKPDMRVYAQLETEKGERRLWETAVLRDFLLALEPRQFIIVRHTGHATSKSGKEYRTFTCQVHRGDSA